MRRTTALTPVLALALVLAIPVGARGDVRQPDGTAVPQGPGLQQIFTMRGERIDAVRDAATTPERFVPKCSLRFTLVSRAAARYKNSFGWYNVRPGRGPTLDELNEIIPCTARSGESFTVNIARDPRYAGGEIGFFLRTPQLGTGGCGNTGEGGCCATVTPGSVGWTYFSERGYNPDSRGASSIVHLLVYDSTITPAAFYFAWEDKYDAPDAGVDNNFTDFVMLVDGIVCSGAGGPCNTGMRGACSAGTLQCDNGRLACRAFTGPSAERCDGVDNDCNGTVDEGANLCPDPEVCDHGRCVSRCLEGGCFQGFTCVADQGVCVESSCARIRCPENQRCVGGRCIGACDGVRCPGTQVCRVGRCVDPCLGVNCGADEVCVAGTCTPRCSCRPCAAGQTCGSDGRCITNECARANCSPGTVCSGGQCVDPCQGANCPASQRCHEGACVDIDLTTGQMLPPPTSPMSSDDGGTDGGVRDGGRRTTSSDAGCGCHAAGTIPHRGAFGALVAIGLATLARMTRRRRRSTSR